MITFDQLIQLLKECIERENQLAKMKAALRDAIAAVKTVDELKKNIPDMVAKIIALEADQVKGLSQALEVANALQQNQTPPPPPDGTVKAGDLATQFRLMMDSIQSDARAPRDGEVATTLKSLDIELKGLIVVKDDEAHVIPPAPGSTIDPASLSTIRMSFGTIPILKAAQPTAPPTPGGTPAPPAGIPSPKVPPTTIPPITRRPRTVKPK